MYIRTDNNIDTNIPVLKEVFKNTHPYHTLLSRFNFYKIDELSNAFRFFYKHFVTQSFVGDEENWRWRLDNLLRENCMPYHIDNLSKLLKIADTGIDSIQIKSQKSSLNNKNKEVNVGEYS